MYRFLLPVLLTFCLECFGNPACASYPNAIDHPSYTGNVVLLNDFDIATSNDFEVVRFLISGKFRFELPQILIRLRVSAIDGNEAILTGFVGTVCPEWLNLACSVVNAKSPIEEKKQSFFKSDHSDVYRSFKKMLVLRLIRVGFKSTDYSFQRFLDSFLQRGYLPGQNEIRIACFFEHIRNPEVGLCVKRESCTDRHSPPEADDLTLSVVNYVPLGINLSAVRSERNLFRRSNLKIRSSMRLPKRSNRTRQKGEYQFQWIRIRRVGENRLVYPDGGDLIENLSGQDIDISENGEKWFHLLGTTCLNDLPRYKQRLHR